MPRYFYLLENLALFNSCLILVEMELSAPLSLLFQLFWELAGTNLNTRTEFHMVDILVSILTETDEIDDALFDALLAPLLPKRKVRIITDKHAARCRCVRLSVYQCPK